MGSPQHEEPDGRLGTTALQLPRRLTSWNVCEGVTEVGGSTQNVGGAGDKMWSKTQKERLEQRISVHLSLCPTLQISTMRDCTLSPVSQNELSSINTLQLLGIWS